MLLRIGDRFPPCGQPTSVGYTVPFMDIRWCMIWRGRPLSVWWAGRIEKVSAQKSVCRRKSGGNSEWGNLPWNSEDLEGMDSCRYFSYIRWRYSETSRGGSIKAWRRNGFELEEAAKLPKGREVDHLYAETDGVFSRGSKKKKNHEIRHAVMYEGWVRKVLEERQLDDFSLWMDSYESALPWKMIRKLKKYKDITPMSQGVGIVSSTGENTFRAHLRTIESRGNGTIFLTVVWRNVAYIGAKMVLESQARYVKWHAPTCLFTGPETNGQAAEWSEENGASGTKPLSGHSPIHRFEKRRDWRICYALLTDKTTRKKPATITRPLCLVPGFKNLTQRMREQVSEIAR